MSWTIDDEIAFWERQVADTKKAMPIASFAIGVKHGLRLARDEYSRPPVETEYVIAHT